MNTRRATEEGNQDLDLLSEYLQEELEHLENLHTLPDYEPSHPRARGLRNALVEILNEIIPQEKFYSKELFAGIDVQEDTERFVAEYLNRTDRSGQKRC